MVFMEMNNENHLEQLKNLVDALDNSLSNEMPFVFSAANRSTQIGWEETVGATA